MTRYDLWRRSGLVALLAFSAAPALGQSGTPDREWRTRGGDLANTRYSPLAQIDATNFDTLELAWRFGTDNLGPRLDYRWQTTPLVADGVMYTTAGSRRAVAALDAATGELLWVHRMDEGRRGELATRGGSGRGVAYWTDDEEERVFYITPGYRLVGLDARTGVRIPSFGNDGIVDLRLEMDQPLDLVTADVSLRTPPVVAGNTVIVGASHAPGQVPRSRSAPKGHVRAYDVLTGERLWIFHTIPAAGEFGADTWLNDSRVYTGNTGVWAQITVDLESGLVYLPIETPTGDHYGGHRPGDNLFSDSLVAVDLETGERVWPLPVRPPRYLGLRPSVRADPGRHHGGRQGRQGGCPAHEAELAVCVRQGDGRAGVAHRGASRRGRRCSGRMVCAHAAVSDKAARLRPPGGHDRRPG